ncbi:hypothetical protein [Nostoc sp.]
MSQYPVIHAVDETLRSLIILTQLPFKYLTLIRLNGSPSSHPTS